MSYSSRSRMSTLLFKMLTVEGTSSMPLAPNFTPLFGNALDVDTLSYFLEKGETSLIESGPLGLELRGDLFYCL